MLTHGFTISGTDTDVGKTVVTAALLRALRQHAFPAMAVKPVQTGVLDPAHDGDAARYSDAVQDLPTKGHGAVTLRAYALAASPHLAARNEGQELDAETLLADIAALQQEAFLLVEGAGGLYVPLNDTVCMVDIFARLGLPLIVVAANRLGVLNHCLLTVAAAQQKGIAVAAIVVTQCKPLTGHKDAETIAQDTVPHLQACLPHIPVLELPHCAAINDGDAHVRLQGWDTLAHALKPLVTLACQKMQRSSHSSDASVAWACDTALPQTALPKAPTVTIPLAQISVQDVLQLDAAHIWHPYTSATTPLPVREVSHTAGQCIHLRDGRALVDGMSSWWCAIHGYGHPRLVRALQDQAQCMSHVMFGGLTHQPVVRLTQSLLPLLPAGLERIFYADSGSVAVEVALKMALQYAYNTGRADRNIFLVPRGGYHGDTVGAMSVCDPVNGMHSVFTGFLPQQDFVDRPNCAFGAFNTALSQPQVGDASTIPFDPACMEPLEQAFASHGQRAAAFIVEPIVQGAGGMWMYHPEYLRRAFALCREYGVLFIADEIATGFGRTGKMFACEWAGISPDILCMGKALTGGMMTLAATACSAPVAEGISLHGGVFMHGPTFMANPLACAVAHASVETLLESPWQARVARIEQGLMRGLSPCVGAKGVAQVRVLGAIGVVECQQPVPVEALQRFFVQQGVWLRPFGRLIYAMPPYTCTEQEIDTITTALCAAVQQGIHCP